MPANKPFHSNRSRMWKRSRQLQDNGEFVPGHRIQCSTIGCVNVQIMPDRGETQIPPDQVEKRFSRDGWHVANKSKDDQCPDCVKRKRTEKRMRHSSLNYPCDRPAPDVHLIVNNDAPMGEPPVAQANTAPAANEITRDSRRIIMHKLEEVYEDVTKGYRAPWTDQAVAKDLGIPLAWVVAIRNEFFGPARDNDEIRDLMEQIKTANENVTKVVASATEMQTAGTSLQGKLLNMNGTLNEVKRTLEALLRKADAIAKALTP